MYSPPTEIYTYCHTLSLPDALPISFGQPCEFVGGHVIARPPHRAGVGKAKLARARIGDIDHAVIIALHRLADLVPAYPHFLQLRGIADGAHLLFDEIGRDHV